MRVIQKSGVLWTVQALLAVLFLFAGGMKLAMPVEALQQGPIALPVSFLKFIGVAEVTGALGLILPGLLRVHRELTPFAAIGLVIIMSGAVTISVTSMGIGAGVVPFITGLLATYIVLGRRQWTSVPATR